MIEYSIGIPIKCYLFFVLDDSITFAEPIGYYINKAYYLKTNLNLTIYYKEDFSVLHAILIIFLKTGLNYIDFVSINLPRDEADVIANNYYENISD